MSQCSLYTGYVVRLSMAKSDSFYIRASVGAGASYAQTAIDLGAYVDALGKSVLRIHNVQVQYTKDGAIMSPVDNAGGAPSLSRWQLTTQSQTAMQLTTDKSVISAGSLTVGPAPAGDRYEVEDMNVQEWTNGYLVAVEQIYLAGQKGSNMDDATVSVVLECTVETLNQSAAMALALSQQ